MGKTSKIVKNDGNRVKRKIIEFALGFIANIFIFLLFLAVETSLTAFFWRNVFMLRFFGSLLVFLVADIIIIAVLFLTGKKFIALGMISTFLVGLLAAGICSIAFRGIL